MRNKGGYSLVELIVVVAIFVTISSVVLFDQNKFSSDVVLTSTAYEVALAIREAQSYGVSVKSGDSSNANFSGAFGIYFSDVSDNLSTFSLFADINGDGQYTASVDKIVKKFTLDKGITLSDFNVYDTNSLLLPTPLSNQLSITFKRPSLSALIYYYYSGPKMTKTYFKVNSSLGDRSKYIEVLNTGQITVSNNKPN